MEARLPTFEGRTRSASRCLAIITRQHSTGRHTAPVQQTLSDRLATAQQTLDDKVTQAYEYGPGAAIEMFLGSTTPADYASAQVFATSAFGVTPSQSVMLNVPNSEK